MGIRQLPLQSSSLVLFVLLAPVFTASRIADAFSGFSEATATVTGLRAGVPSDGPDVRAGEVPAGAGDAVFGTWGLEAVVVAEPWSDDVRDEPEAPRPAASGVSASHVAAMDPCRDHADGPRNDRALVCEVRTFTLAPRDRWDVHAGPNGGIRVEAWDRADVDLRAVVRAEAPTEAAARRLVAAVAVETDGAVRTDAPRTGQNESVSVSYELRVPRRANLDLTAANGGIHIEGVAGDLTFRTANGGVGLVGVGGDVRGGTTNGGLSVDLAGSTWVGRGLDVETTNGGVRLRVPEGYSAELETGTTNGQLTHDLPITAGRPRATRLTTRLGRGGSRVRVVTTNGGVTVARN
ncbi:MAG TPA: hypothetical protein VF576_11415 [Rubricoccaceae bacterium]